MKYEDITSCPGCLTNRRQGKSQEEEGGDLTASKLVTPAEVRP